MCGSSRSDNEQSVSIAIKVGSIVEKIVIIFMSAISGDVNVKLSKEYDTCQSFEKTMVIRGDKKSSGNLINDLKMKFFDNMSQKNRLKIFREVMMRKQKELKENNHIYRKIEPIGLNLKLKFDKNEDMKEKIKHSEQKLKYYWKNKFDVKKGYFEIYRKLKNEYDRDQAFMAEWMRIINTYVVFEAIKKKYDNLQRYKANLQTLKLNCFKIWKKSKKTKNFIKRQQDIKILKAVARFSNIRLGFRRPFLVQQSHDVVQRLFTKIFIFKMMEKKLKEFTLKGWVIS